MKLKLWGIVLFILFLPALTFPSNLDLLRISLIEGDVQIRTEETEDWVPASINMPLKEGDRIWVPEEGRVELQFREGSFLRLDEGSALEILTLERDSFQFYLSEGRAYIHYRGIKNKVLQIDTPLTSIRVFERARFRVDITREGFNEISVYKGYIYAESREGRTRVNEGKTLSIGEGAYAELSPLGAPDEWERWNRERDRRVSARRPPQYLPEELYPYAYDFEENGRWVYVREYGYVWTPTVVISVGWAPYRIGKWVWIRGDYVWISYEPWGWVPYHYGRWAFIVNIGWCWVPPPRGAVFWGPGFVAWVHTPHYVSWVPLAPGEIYYGYGHYGPHSVNITQVDIKHIDVHKVVYKNVHVHNAVTVVHRENFIKGRHEPLKLKENPFLHERISIGRPEIPPEKELRIPVIKEIPHHKRPPEPIREIRVREIKERRPLEKKPEISVLKPGSRAEEMKPRIKERKILEREKGKMEIKRAPERGEIRPQSEPKRVIERPLQSPPKRSEGIEKPKESIPIGKPQEKLRENRSLEKESRLEKTERGIERTKESKPYEKEVEKEEHPKGERGGFGGRK